MKKNKKKGGLKNERKIISIRFYSVYMCDMDNVSNDLRIKKQFKKTLDFENIIL